MGNTQYPIGPPEDSFESAARGQRPFADILWFGVDRSGVLGVFSCAGHGRVPRTVFTNRDAHRSCIELLGAAEPHTHASVLVRYPVDDTWRAAAERGFFAFDYDLDSERWPATGPYQLIARPATPRHLSSLPIRLQDYVTLTTFRALEFAGASHLRIEEHFTHFNF